MHIYTPRKLSGMAHPFLIAAIIFITILLPDRWCSGQQTLDVATQAAESDDKPFRLSELLSSKTSLREGETNEYTLIVRYDGEENPLHISVSMSIPAPSLLVSSSPELALLENERELTWEGEIHKGKELTFYIRVVTLPDSASERSLFGSAGIFWQDGVEWLESETEIHSKLSAGSSRVMTYIMVYLIGGPALALAIPWIIQLREKRHRLNTRKPRESTSIDSAFLYAMSFFFVVMIGLAHLIGHIVWEDFRRLTVFPQTECTLLDKKIGTSVMKATTGKTYSKDTDVNELLVAVRYIVDGKEIVTSGPAQITSLRSSSEKSVAREFSRYERGRQYSCWYDPEAPSTFCLVRGLSWGWYLIGVLPLIFLFILGRVLLPRLWR